MQVSDHVVSLYVATCGQNGPGLGSDEKEIILLVYVILDSTNGQIIGTKQLLVRPDNDGYTKDRTISQSSDISNSESNTSNNNNNINNKNLANPNITISNTDSDQNLANNIISTTAANATIQSPTTTTIVGNIVENSLVLPLDIAQTAGKSLNEVIADFDDYLRSLSLNDSNITVITDGQLPLRQCLHRESCTKDIELPTYYNQFSDLRKEYLKHKSGDLSRALVPVRDIKKILQMPQTQIPQSIAEMLNELNITSTEDTTFYIKESRDMVSVIQYLIKAGHKFVANEIVNLILEPGICSIDDEIDGNCIVRARGLPWQSSDQDIAKFFRGLNVAKGGVALCLSPLGRRNGEALIRFISQEHRDMALKRHKHHIGNRYIEVYRASGDDFLAIAGGASNEAQTFLSKGAQVIIRMRGLPYDCTAKQVLDFFTAGENPCAVLDGTEGVLFVKKPDGRATGDAFVLFAKDTDAPKALSRHRESIGQRYIELFRSTTAEVQQVLNRSMDPKTFDNGNHQAPLIAQLPTVQLAMLPQHLITSGTSKNCIRLRGLPYEALVEHILHFLDDFAKHIIFQGVHMVINAQGQPSGEAFIQMDTEDAARLCAQRKHNQFMVFGKKYRYIEVFQCSGDDMNMVLNGGLQSPIPSTHPHSHHPCNKQPSLISQGSLFGAPFGAFTQFGPPMPTTLLAAHHLNRNHHHHHHHHHGHHPPQPSAFYPHSLVYWPYPSPPVSPTSYFHQSTTHTATQITGNIGTPHQPAMYALDFVPSVASNNYTNEPSPLSPTCIAIPSSSTTAGLIFSQNKSPAIPILSTKQLPKATIVPTTANTSGGGGGGGGGYNGQSIRNKISLHQSSQLSQVSQHIPIQPNINNYHATSPPTTAVVPRTLLTIDTFT